MKKKYKRTPEEIARREKLVNVFNDTKQINKDRFLLNVKTQKVSPGWMKSNFLRNILTHFNSHTNTVQIINQDCVEVANELSLQGRTCMLNMANAFQRGGGVERGAMAQEEELCRRSNLWHALRPSYYPMKNDDFIYSKNISFYKDKHYELMPEFKCDIITIAAPCLIGVKKLPANYDKIVEKKIKQMLFYPAQIGCKNLVLSAFGCGAFKNNPIYMANKFKTLIDKLPYKFDNIVFAILDDKNSEANKISNFKSFKEILDNKCQSIHI